MTKETAELISRLNASRDSLKQLNIGEYTLIRSARDVMADAANALDAYDKTMQRIAEEPDALAHRQAAALIRGGGEPIPMILYCPACGLQHVDAPETPVQFGNGMGTRGEKWDNPPHRSHLCHGCGHIWRPADVPTEGVAHIETVGLNDSPALIRSAPAPGREEIEDAVEGLVMELMQSVHVHYQADEDPDFGEYARDYTRAILALFHAPAEAGGGEDIEACDWPGVAGREDARSERGAD